MVRRTAYQFLGGVNVAIHLLLDICAMCLHVLDEVRHEVVNFGVEDNPHTTS